MTMNEKYNDIDRLPKDELSKLAACKELIDMYTISLFGQPEAENLTTQSYVYDFVADFAVETIRQHEGFVEDSHISSAVGEQIAARESESDSKDIFRNIFGPQNQNDMEITLRLVQFGSTLSNCDVRVAYETVIDRVSVTGRNKYGRAITIEETDTDG